MNLVSIINPKNLGEVSDELEYNSIYDLAAIISSQSWAPGIFSTRKRTISNLARIELFVLDVDDGCDLDRAKIEFKDFKHIIAASRSHRKEKNGTICDRFRVVLFMDSSLDSDGDFKATWETAHKRWPFIDRACKDSSRFFYASPEIISIRDTGLSFATSVAAEIRIRDDSRISTEAYGKLGPLGRDSSTKGELWKSTLKFLLEGAPAGQRHTELVKAVGNLREQGYTEPEVLEKLETMSTAGDWTQPGLSKIDRNTVSRMYARETKYPYVPQEKEEAVTPIIVNASDLLAETFEYLSDKDKVKGEPTGIDGLDKLLGGGFRTGELTVLMAQAKTGKNTLYHYLIYKHLERGIPFGYASRELNPATEVIPNLLSIALKTNAWTNALEPAYRDAARQTLAKWMLYFAPGYGHFSTQDLETWFRTLKDLGVSHFLFDHFHYALLSEDYESTATLIKKLKTLTKDLDIHLSLIVQPRSLREGESLSLATLRGGAAIGQALDNLLILERVRGEQNISKLTLEVARHKLAKLGDINLMYNSDTTEFVEVDRRTVTNSPPVPKGINDYGSRFRV